MTEKAVFGMHLKPEEKEGCSLQANFILVAYLKSDV